MRVIALIEQPNVVRRILMHLGLWCPAPPHGTERAPPHGIERLRHAAPHLTYHPVPDIA